MKISQALLFRFDFHTKLKIRNTLPGPGFFWIYGIIYDLSGDFYLAQPKLKPFASLSKIDLMLYWVADGLYDCLKISIFFPNPIPVFLCDNCD